MRWQVTWSTRWGSRQRKVARADGPTVHEQHVWPACRRGGRRPRRSDVEETIGLAAEEVAASLALSVDMEFLQSGRGGLSGRVVRGSRGVTAFPCL